MVSDPTQIAARYPVTIADTTYAHQPKWNWFPKMDPTDLSFSTFSTNNLSNLFSIFHHSLKSSMKWSRHRHISKCVYSSEAIYCTGFCHVGPRDFNCFDGFLNCYIDFKNILNYSIRWDIDYTQACTTPIRKIKTSRVNTHQVSIYCCNDYFKRRVE